MPVDSFKFLPPILADLFRETERKPGLPIPWTPLKKPLTECRFALISTGGFYHKGVDPPFDMEREKQEPTWGDPTYRAIPVDIAPAEIGVSHLHINTAIPQADINVLLPIDRFQELLTANQIGGLAKNAYSFMGFQGFPADTAEWETKYVPEVAEILTAEDVDCVLLTPA